MVRLDRIYTGGGDHGETSIGDGSRVAKLHPRIIAGGAVDELNCVLGVAASACPQSSFQEIIFRMQQFLFDLGADLCTPFGEDKGEPNSCPRIKAAHATRLEELIDDYVAQLEPLTSFVLPGGTAAAASLHHARSVCRRAELDVLRLSEIEPVNHHLLVSLNRLSDLLFVMARIANDCGRQDVLWKPGQTIL